MRMYSTSFSSGRNALSSFRFQGVLNSSDLPIRETYPTDFDLEAAVEVEAEAEEARLNATRRKPTRVRSGVAMV